MPKRKFTSPEINKTTIHAIIHHNNRVLTDEEGAFPSLQHERGDTHEKTLRKLARQVLGIDVSVHARHMGLEGNRNGYADTHIVYRAKPSSDTTHDIEPVIPHYTWHELSENSLPRP